MSYSPRVAKSRTRLSDFTFTLSNKDLLYCTGNSTQYPVKTNGKDSEDVCIYIPESFCCTLETNIIL